MTKPSFHLVGDQALLAEWPGLVTANRLALALKIELEARPLPGLLEAVPARQSLLLRFDPLATDPPTIEQEILMRLEGLPAVQAGPGRTVRLPVCYDPDLGPDLEALAKTAGMTRESAAELHAGTSYDALFLGFLPGFAYLGGLPAQLQAPRLATPRTRVPAGSVAVAEDMSAVYPLESPGGWHLIGQTPLKLFDPERAQPFLLAPGDRVSFQAIARDDFERMKRGEAAP